MKAITTEKDFPKFLRVSAIIKSKSYNKYLQKPFTEGEIVKIVPYDEQHSIGVQMEKSRFLRQYINILRKDSNGKFTIRYTASWEIFEPLKKNK